jgi:hypothetical protein
LISRDNSSNNIYYECRAMPGNASALQVYKSVNGTDTRLKMANVGAINLNTQYRMRFQTITNGSTTGFNAKIWATSTTEPTAWQIVSSTATDNDGSLQGVSGYCGLLWHYGGITTTPITTTYDNFEAVNIVSGNASYTKDWQDSTTTGWTVGAGTWGVAADGNSNRYYLSSNPGGSGNKLGAYSTMDSARGSFVFTSDARATSSSTGNFAVVFGYLDSNNYYYMNFSTVNNATALYKVVNGTATQIASYSGTLFSDTNYHAVKISRIGSNISVWFDGLSVLSTTDSTFLGGKVGLGSYTGTAYFDNVVIG